MPGTIPAFACKKLYFDVPEDNYHEAIVGFVSCINDIYNILVGANMFLTAVEKSNLETNFYNMGKWHTLRRQCADTRHELSFQVKPTAHYAQELAHQS